jgi:hypothetical protein
MSGADSFECGVHRFVVPTHPLLTGVSDRRVAVMFTTGKVIEKSDDSDGIRYETAPGCADFSRVGQGRVPVMLEHSRYLEGLIGIVEACWLDDGAGHALLRLGRSAAADEILGKISDGLPISVSLGAVVLNSRTEPGPTGRPLVIITRWSLREISFVTAGADPAARVVGHGAEAVAMAEQHMAADRDRSRALAEDVLHAGAWRRWAVQTGDALAERFGIADPAFATALYAAADEKLAALAGAMAEARA